MDAQSAATIKGAGTLLKSAALFRSGRAAASEADAVALARLSEAGQLRRRAGAERAASQRRAANERRREKLVQSALQARAAASGGGATDPTVNKLSADIAAEGQYRALTALFEGEELARALEFGADLKGFEAGELRKAGAERKRARQAAAFTTLLGGFDDLSAFNKFGEDPELVGEAFEDYDAPQFAGTFRYGHT